MRTRGTPNAHFTSVTAPALALAAAKFSSSVLLHALSEGADGHVEAFQAPQRHSATKDGLGPTGSHFFASAWDARKARMGGVVKQWLMVEIFFNLGRWWMLNSFQIS